jgi:plastocyanin
MNPLRTALFIATAGLLLATPVSAQVTGQVRVAGRKDASLPTIVYAERLDAPARPKPQRVKLNQREKAFEPRVLAIPVGSTVDFPNFDTIYHNVFSLSQPEPFDLGLYKRGASKKETFKRPATYRVFCNIHPQMTAVLLILPTDHITQADAEGRYSLALPPGRYRITAWSERSQPASAEITLAAAGASVPDLQLDESQFVELPHKNKYGQDYPKLPEPPAKQN